MSSTNKVLYNSDEKQSGITQCDENKSNVKHSILSPTMNRTTRSISYHSARPKSLRSSSKRILSKSSNSIKTNINNSTTTIPPKIKTSFTSILITPTPTTSVITLTTPSKGTITSILPKKQSKLTSNALKLLDKHSRTPTSDFNQSSPLSYNNTKDNTNITNIINDMTDISDDRDNVITTTSSILH